MAGATAVMPAPTRRPFREALTEMLRENDYTTSSGNVKLHAFADELDSVHYETLRQVMAGSRKPSRRLMEEAARALRISPDYFVEYRLAQLRERFDPTEVGFDRALKNLEEWAKRKP